MLPVFNDKMAIPLDKMRHSPASPVAFLADGEQEDVIGLLFGIYGADDFFRRILQLEYLHRFS